MQASFSAKKLFFRSFSRTGESPLFPDDPPAVGKGDRKGEPLVFVVGGAYDDSFRLLQGLFQREGVGQVGIGGQDEGHLLFQKLFDLEGEGPVRI